MVSLGLDTLNPPNGKFGRRSRRNGCIIQGRSFSHQELAEGPLRGGEIAVSGLDQGQRSSAVPTLNIQHDEHASLEFSGDAQTGDDSDTATGCSCLFYGLIAAQFNGDGRNDAQSLELVLGLPARRRSLFSGH